MKQNSLDFDCETYSVLFSQDLSKECVDRCLTRIEVTEAISNVISPSTPSKEPDQTRTACSLPPSSKTAASFEVRSYKTVTLSPNSHARVKVRLTPSDASHVLPELGYFVPLSTTSTAYEVVEQLVDVGKGGEFYLWLTNPTDESVSVRRFLLGSLFPVSEEELVSDPSEVINQMTGLVNNVSNSSQPISDPNHPPAPKDMNRESFEVVMEPALCHIESPELKRKILDLAYNFRDIFATHESHLGQCNIVEHSIETGDSKPVKSHPYSVPHSLRQTLKDKIETLLETGIIEECDGPYSSPVILIKKSSGEHRLVVDYRLLNRQTRKDCYGLPRIQDMLDRMSESTIFSTMDFLAGYYQLLVKESDRDKTGFITPFGLYRFVRAPFGLTNMPPTFQRLMDNVFKSLLYKALEVFLDDVTVHSQDVTSHFEYLHQVFQKIRSTNLRLRPSKCKFLAKEVTLLGHVLTEGTIRPTDEKIKAVKQIAYPKDVKSLRSAFGLFSWFRKYIPDFAKIAAPLTELLKKGENFVFGEKEKAAFDELRARLISEPILGLPRINQAGYLLATDANQDTIAAKLSQFQDGREVILQYGSRRLTKAEINYSVSHREALAVVHFIKVYRQYLYGTKFRVETDHQSLRWLMTTKDPTGRLARWSLTLQDYDFEIAYRPGPSNKVPDALTRLPINLVSTSELALPPNLNEKELRSSQKSDRFCSSIIAYLKGKSTMPLDVEKQIIREISNFEVDNGILCRVVSPHKAGRKDEIRLVPVLPSALIPKFLSDFHDSPYGGHFGHLKTYSAVRQHLWFPNMYTVTKQYCTTCDTCLKRKSLTFTPNAPLQKIEIPSAPLQTIFMDLVGPLPKTSEGHTYILTVTDYLTRHLHLIPIADAKGATVIQAFLEKYCHIFGFCSVVCSDNGSHFKNKEFQEFLNKLSIQHHFSTPEHPATQGVLERRHRDLKNILSQFVDQHHKDDWDRWLSYVSFAMNTAWHQTLDESPFYMMFLRDSVLPVDRIVDSRVSYDCHESFKSEALARMKRTYEAVAQNIEFSQDSQKLHHDKLGKHSPYQPGDVVYLNVSPKPGLGQKLDLIKFDGPFRVIERRNEVNYVIQKAEGRSKPKIVHYNRLKRGAVRTPWSFEATPDEFTSQAEEGEAECLNGGMNVESERECGSLETKEKRPRGIPKSVTPQTHETTVVRISELEDFSTPSPGSRSLYLDRNDPTDNLTSHDNRLGTMTSLPQTATTSLRPTSQGDSDENICRSNAIPPSQQETGSDRSVSILPDSASSVYDHAEPPNLRPCRSIRPVERLEYSKMGGINATGIDRVAAFKLLQKLLE